MLTGIHRKKRRPTLCTSMSLSISSIIWSTSTWSDGGAWRRRDIFAYVIARCVPNLITRVSLLKDIFRDLVFKPSDVPSLSLVNPFLCHTQPCRAPRAEAPLLPHRIAESGNVYLDWEDTDLAKVLGRPKLSQDAGSLLSVRYSHSINSYAENFSLCWTLSFMLIQIFFDIDLNPWLCKIYGYGFTNQSCFLNWRFALRFAISKLMRLLPIYSNVYQYIHSVLYFKKL